MRTLLTGILAAGAIVAALYVSRAVGNSQGLSALPAAATTPRDNASTAARVALGRTLFWDPMLSGTNDVACATCHHPRFGYAENRDLSIGASGVGLGDRR